MSGTDQPSLVVDREELSSRLREVAPPLAELYDGARHIVASPTFPGRPYFLAHAVREIANGLPEWITGRAAEKESSRLSRIAERWETAFPRGIRSDGSELSRPPRGDVLVPRDLFDELSEVLNDRNRHTTSRDAVHRLFERLGPGNRYLQMDLPHLAREWMRLRRWFEATTHARRSSSAAAPGDKEAMEQFGRFERWLAALLGGFFAVRRDLELVLDSATPDRLPEIVPLLVADQHRHHFFERLGQAIHVPRPAELRPSAELLAMRYELFTKAG